MLDASVSGDDVILQVIRLDAEICEVAEEVLVDHLELAAEHSPGVDTLLPCPQSRTRLPKLRSKSSQRYAC